MNTITVGDLELDVGDEDQVYGAIANEIVGAYRFDEIDFSPGDVVLDVGAHVGLTSMYLALRNPAIVVHAFEPWPANHERLRRNLRVNGARNVTAHKLAMTADGRHLRMVGGSHSAEPSAFYTATSQQPIDGVRSTTIPRVLERYGIERVALLKLDCEGAEHEILADAGGWIDRIDHIRGEIHMIGPLRAAGYSVEATRAIAGAEQDWMVVEGA